MRGQLERQPVQEGAAEVRRRGEGRRRGAALLLALVEQQPDLHEQELFEHEAGARDACLLEVARQMHGHGGVRARRQPFALAQRGRQRVGEPAHRRPHGAQEAAQQPRRHLLAGRVHRDDPLGVHGVALLLLEDLVALDDERRAAALRPIRAAHAQPHALRQHLDEVALVEPDRLDGAGLVAEHDAHDVHPTTRRALGDDAPDGAAHGGLLADLEVADALAVAEILVAPREVVDEVAHGLEAEGRQAPGHRPGDVLQLGQRRCERGWVEEESRDGRPLVVPAAAEAEREMRARSLRDHSKGGSPRADVRADHRAAVALQHEMRVGPQALDHLADELRLFVVEGVDGARSTARRRACCSPRRSAAWRPWPS